MLEILSMHIEKKKLRSFDEDRGSLVPIELSDLNFIPKRLFYVTNVPEMERRGNHAHFKTEQILICIQGRVGVYLLHNNDSGYIILDKNEYVYVPNYYWDAQDFITGNDILLVLCSTNYDKADYIEDIPSYLKLFSDE